MWGIFKEYIYQTKCYYSSVKNRKFLFGWNDVKEDHGEKLIQILNFPKLPSAP